jgi:hypothetical protein
VIDRGFAALVHDVQTDERFADAESLLGSGVRSLIAAPLLTPDGALGMIALDSRLTVRQFQEDDTELLVGLAAVAALRIRNVSSAETSLPAESRATTTRSSSVSARPAPRSGSCPGRGTWPARRRFGRVTSSSSTPTESSRRRMPRRRSTASIAPPRPASPDVARASASLRECSRKTSRLSSRECRSPTTGRWSWLGGSSPDARSSGLQLFALSPRSTTAVTWFPGAWYSTSRKLIRLAIAIPRP